MADFAGFTQETIRFLSGLGRNNTRAWFEAHREAYEEHYLAPAIKFVEAMGHELLELAPQISVEPRVSGSIFRIHRDVRFSKDKTPYKDHIDLTFWEGGDKRTAPSGLFLRIRADGFDIGAGAHHFDKAALERYRKRVADDATGVALEKIVAKARRDGLTIGGEQYKKLPKGMQSVSEARDALLRHGAMWCSAHDELPPEFHSKAFTAYCARLWKKMLPLHRWLLQDS